VKQGSCASWSCNLNCSCGTKFLGVCTNPTYGPCKLAELTCDGTKQLFNGTCTAWNYVSDCATDFANATAGSAEIAVWGTEMVALIAAKETANGVLELAKQTLSGFQLIVDNSRWTLDAAKIALEVAKGPVSASQLIVDNSRWTLDAAKIALEAAKGPVIASQFVVDQSRHTLDVAIYAMEGYKLTLDGVVIVYGALGEVALYIVDYGLEALLAVRKAGFDAGMVRTAIDGTVSLYVDLDFQGKAKTYNVDFNLKDGVNAAAQFGKMLLREIGAL
jgi:hypothetical protein